MSWTADASAATDGAAHTSRERAAEATVHPTN
jgi:hypothetical protein